MRPAEKTTTKIKSVVKATEAFKKPAAVDKTRKTSTKKPKRRNSRSSSDDSNSNKSDSKDYDRRDKNRKKLDNTASSLKKKRSKTADLSLRKILKKKDDSSGRLEELEGSTPVYRTSSTKKNDFRSPIPEDDESLDSSRQ